MDRPKREMMFDLIYLKHNFVTVVFLLRCYIFLSASSRGWGATFYTHDEFFISFPLVVCSIATIRHVLFAAVLWWTSSHVRACLTHTLQIWCALLTLKSDSAMRALQPPRCCEDFWQCYLGIMSVTYSVCLCFGCGLANNLLFDI